MKTYVVTRARPYYQITAGQLEKADIPFIYAVAKNDDEGYPPGEHEIFDVYGISDKRQALLDANPHRFIMLDDDIKFLVRSGPGVGKTEKSSSEQIQQLFTQIESLMGDYRLVGLAERYMIHSRSYPFAYDCKQVHIFGIDGAWIKEKGIRFDRIKLAGDIDFVMQVIAAGGRTILITDHCHQDAPMFSWGGCNEWRTRKMFSEEHLKLQALWPDFIEIKRHHGTLSPRISWKKFKEHYVRSEA